MKDKKIQIYEGVLALLDGGKTDPRDLTVSKIAQAADVGKGTVYEYFESKDEVLAKTIYYKLEQECVEMEILLDEKADFRHRCYSIFDLVLEGIKNPISIFHLLFFDIGAQNVIPLLQHFPEEFYQKKDYFMKGIAELLRQGEEEKAIDPITDFEYAIFVLVSVLAGLHMVAIEGSGKKSFEEKKDMAYELLIRAFRK